MDLIMNVKLEVTYSEPNYTWVFTEIMTYADFRDWSECWCPEPASEKASPNDCSWYFIYGVKAVE